jgi:hypothetical protein
VGPEPKNIPKTKYAKMYITRNHISKIRFDLVSITSRIGFVDKPASTVSSATGLFAGGLGVGAGGFAGGAVGFGGADILVGGAGVFAAGWLLDILAPGVIGGFGVDSPCEGGVPADADISFYIILRYFFR